MAQDNPKHVISYSHNVPYDQPLNVPESLFARTMKYNNHVCLFDHFTYINQLEATHVKMIPWRLFIYYYISTIHHLPSPN